MATLKDINYGIGKYLVPSDASYFPDIVTNRKNIDLMNFKVAVNNAYSLYNFKDGMVDAYQDETGIDGATTTNDSYDSTNKVFSPNFGNYFGNGELGNCQFSSGGITQTSDTVAIDTVLTTGSEASGPGTSSYNTNQVPNSSACYELTVPNKNGGHDGDMFVAQFKDLTIDGSITLTVDQPNRGLFVYVDGDCTINGALSMTCRGGNSNPNNSGGSDSSAVSATGLRIPVAVVGGSDTLAAADFAGAGNPAIAAVANHGGIAGNGWIYGFNKLGTTGAPDKGANNGVSARMSGTGAGGTGGVTASNGGSAWSGYGGDGGAFSGGAASGSARKNGPGHQSSPTGGHFGGAGSGAHGAPGGWASGGGGAGNPGAGSQGSGYNVNNPGAQNGVGGIIMLIVGGDLTIGGSITARGAKGGRGYIGGGSSASGAAIVLYSGAITNPGNIDLSFEPGGWNYNNQPSGNNPGNGGKWNEQIDAKNATGGMQIYSTTQTAQAAPDESRLMLYEEDVDPITLNTDIKGFVSRDNGTTYTQVTLALDSTITHPTSLLLHMDGSNDGTTFTDSSYWQHVPTVSGAVHTDTAVKKFGTASAQFDGTAGTDEHLDYASSPQFGFGTGDWTIDFWVRSPNWSAGSGYGTPFDMRPGSNLAGCPRMFFDTGNSNVPGYTDGTSGTKCGSNVVMVNDTWYHIAVVKYNNVTKVYTDGVTGASGTYPTSFADTTNYRTENILRIGDTSVTADPYAFNGYIDEFRITKGIARWTANFTPDTSPYTGTEGDTRLVSGSVDISGQPAGTDMKYKVETLNDKTLKLHGASLLWA